MSPGPWEDLRREVERLLGMPPGSADPLEGIRKDAQRFEEILGQGFVDMQYMGEAVRHRIEASMDFAFHPGLFEIPKRILQARPPGLNGFRQR